MAADTDLKRRVDLVRLGTVPAVAIVVVVVGLLDLAGHLGQPSALVVDGVAGLVAGGWCSLNFWRCRHAHCLVTGPGWVGLGMSALIEASLGHSLIGGYEQDVFLGVLALAVAFEVVWYGVHRTNAVAPSVRP
jgi:hypothetical protein